MRFCRFVNSILHPLKRWGAQLTAYPAPEPLEELYARLRRESEDLVMEKIDRFNGLSEQ